MPAALTTSRRPWRAGLVLLALALVWLVVLLVAPILGSQPLALGEALAGRGEAGVIFWQLRLPRVLLALVAGGVLALAGLGFQTLFRNPMAEPYTLGVAGGAALGAVLAIASGSTASGWGPTAASFVGALAAGSLVVGLAWRRPASATSTLLLAGIAVSLSTSALILFVQFLADPTKTFRMVRWMMGGLAVVGYRDLAWLAPWLPALLALLFGLRWDLNLLLTGEETAVSRGVDLGRLRLLLLAGISLAIGALVAVTGPIGFVGLIVPHFVRLLLGQDHRLTVPGVALGGGIFLAVADLGARQLMAPAELPVGVLTALLGGPFFLWVLLAGGRD